MASGRSSNQVIPLFPEGYLQALNAGKELAQQEKWEQAIACYREAIELNPNGADVYHCLGDSTVKLGRVQEAIAAYQKAVELKPDWGEVYQKLAQLLQDKNYRCEEISSPRRRRKMAIDPALPHYNLGSALAKQEDFAGAVEAYKKAIAANPNLAKAHHGLGEALNRLERWEEAVEAYRSAIALEPDFSWSHNSLGDALSRLERWEEAVEAYRSAIGLNPDFVWSHYNLGDALSKLEKWEEAIETYRKAADMEPDLPEIEDKLNQALHEQVQARLQQALSYYRKAIEEDPSNIENYQKALEIKPDDAKLYLGLGNALMERGEEEEAIDAYQNAIGIDPSLNQVQSKLEKLLKPTILKQSMKAINEEQIEHEKSTKNIVELSSNLTANSQATDVRLIAFYLPQYHPIPENDEWWGKGFTEWTNVTKAKPLFEGHYQPRLPADLGFYDLRVPEVREAQARLAKKYGIHGFCYYYYWFAGKRLLDRPVDEILKTNKPDFPFCLCWANENWTRRWDGSDNEILMAQEHSFENNKAFAESLVPFLKDERYIRVHGKPLVLIYRSNILPDIEETTKLWRDVWHENGIGEVYLCGCLTFGLQASQVIQWGLDAGVQFPPHGIPAKSIPSDTLGVYDYKGYIYDFMSVVENYLTADLPSEKEFFSVMTSWDNTARKGKSGNAYIHANPEQYELWLRSAIEKTKQVHTGNEQLVFINAWNEWAEGTYLEPDRKYGHQYLQATYKALNGTHSLFNSLKILHYLKIDDRENLIDELKSRIANTERSIEWMIKETKIAKNQYLFLDDIKFIAWDDTPTYLETPSPGTSFELSDYITFSGWSFNKKGQAVVEMKMLDQDREIMKAPVKTERSDVYNAYSECQQSNIGFSIQVQAKNLLTEKEYCEICFYAICEKNKSIKVATIDVKLIEEEKKIGGKLKTKIKWYYAHKENLIKSLDKLDKSSVSPLELQILTEEVEETINYYLCLLKDLKNFILNQK